MQRGPLTAFPAKRGRATNAAYEKSPPKKDELQNSVVGLTRFELVTSRLSVVRSDQLSYRPALKAFAHNTARLPCFPTLIPTKPLAAQSHHNSTGSSKQQPKRPTRQSRPSLLRPCDICAHMFSPSSNRRLDSLLTRQAYSTYARRSRAKESKASSNARPSPSTNHF